jgi:integrase
MKWVSAEARSTSELLSLKKLGANFADRPLAQCTPANLEEALSFCKTVGTFNRYAAMVNAILRLSGSSAKLAPRKEKKKKPRQWITKEQWAKLYKELPVHMQPMAEFAIETGLRQSNVLQLKWEQVDLRRRFVWIEAQEMKDDDALPVPLSSRAHRVLAEKRELLEAAKKRKDDIGQSDVYVFTFRGKPITEIKTAFIAACVRAGLGKYTNGKYHGFTWHGFRHTWATWHVQNKTPLDVLQKLGGWSDQRMVSNYAHHDAGYLAQYADANARRRSR